MSVIGINDPVGDLSQAALDRAKAEATSKGFIVYQSNDMLLLLDFDSSAQMQTFKRLLPRFRQLYPVKSIQYWTSKSGWWHKHIIIRLEESLPVTIRIALQAALGSDPMREILALQRLKEDVDEPSLLFRPAESELKNW